MPRPKKQAKYLNVYLDKQIYDSLSEFCIESGQSKTVAVERAIQMYVKNFGEQKEGEKND